MSDAKKNFIQKQRANRDEIDAAREAAATDLWDQILSEIMRRDELGLDSLQWQFPIDTADDRAIMFKVHGSALRIGMDWHRHNEICGVALVNIKDQLTFNCSPPSTSVSPTT
jgi:hypothetical protein